MRWKALFLLVLTACSWGERVPSEIKLAYPGSGAFWLGVPHNAAWELAPTEPSSWLELTPRKGLGPAQIRVRARGDRLPEAPLAETTYRLSGDLSATIRFLQPQVWLTGRLVEAPALEESRLPGAGLRPRSAPAPTGEVLVKLKPGWRPLLDGLRLLNFDPHARVGKLRSSDPRLLERLRASPGVEWAEPNGWVQAQGEPTDELYPQQWYLRSTGARFAYLGSFARPVTVAVVDTGVRYDHPDLAGRLVLPGEGAYDFVDGDPDPTDPGDTFRPTIGSHGTHVSGIVAARSGTNTLPPQCYEGGQPVCSQSGTVGVAWAAPVRVLPIRVLDPSGNGTFEAVAVAIRYAAGLAIQWQGQRLQLLEPVSVINLSLGSLQYSRALCDAVAEAVQQGVLVVAAAGNYQDVDPGAPFYPASCPGALGVGATDLDYRPTFYSQQNETLALSVPGGDTRSSAAGGILSTTWDFTFKDANQKVVGRPSYAFYMGTSQAAPQASAALALLLSSDPALTPAAAWERLKTRLTDLGTPGRDNAYGYGFLSLPTALGLSLPPGPLAAVLQGPSPHPLLADADGRFSSYVLAGAYTLRVCRDDSANGLCDGGEASRDHALQVPPQPSFEVGNLQGP